MSSNFVYCQSVFLAYWLIASNVLCYRLRKNEWMNENDGKIISIVFVRAVTRNPRSRRDWVGYLLYPIFLKPVL